MRPQSQRAPGPPQNLPPPSQTPPLNTISLLNYLFGNTVFKKVEINDQRYAIYAASLSSQLGNGTKHYALAFVKEHLAIRDSAYLTELDWDNFQTREIKNMKVKLSQQKWDVPKNIPTVMLHAVERTKENTKYLSPDRVLSVILLHDPKKNSAIQYHAQMNLIAALMTFKCVVTRDPAFNRQVTMEDVINSQRAEPYNDPGIPRATPVSNQRNIGLAHGDPREETARPRSKMSPFGDYESPANFTPPVGKGGYQTMALDFSEIAIIPKDFEKSVGSRSAGVRRATRPVQRQQESWGDQEEEQMDGVDPSFEMI
jgi:hypothetical protein